MTKGCDPRTALQARSPLRGGSSGVSSLQRFTINVEPLRFLIVLLGSLLLLAPIRANSPLIQKVPKNMDFSVGQKQLVEHAGVLRLY